ncbi:LPS assembly protein LptD [Candidatus Enterovibrio altilux]|uniref:LPS-assembly protein LptD n=1 Tax=Candidatus Enterovibrio altilux TaxID=1927128 RepID=A0A291B9M0_9GAMM|nr:LPS assembly protein LptD [Candidatus Enterovibrio luxaltus]ATF09673.1 Outer membrane protein Imp, required for envelope biogenesis [Candidatus Enterovibrio luxaltus]
MSLIGRKFLSTILYFILYGPVMAEESPVAQDSQESLQIPTDTCLTPEYLCITRKEYADDIKNALVTIVADHVEAKANEKAIYRGDVVVTQSHRIIKSDVVTLRQPDNIVMAEGNVYFYDGEMTVSGKFLQSNLNTTETTLLDAQYKMMCQPGRGQAKYIFKNGTAFYELEDGTYTTCPDNDNSWYLSAGSITKENGNIFADLYHAQFNVFDIPIAYLPYLRVPVEDGNLTGFLYPLISWHKKDGVTLSTPFYWNIHPQTDMLITPKYMFNRGSFLRIEPRYLIEDGRGSMVFEYMGQDDFYTTYNKSWGFHWQHFGIREHWKYNVNYSKSSDINYFSRNTDSRISHRENHALLQTGNVSYRAKNWDSILSVKNFQSLMNNRPVYRLLPQLTVNYYFPELGYGLDFSMQSQISKFITDDDSKPDATRINLEPTLTLPYHLPWLSAEAEGKVFYSYFNQTNIDRVTNNNGMLKSNVSRVIPMVKLNSVVILERDALIWGNNYTQTLEPQVQYLYIKDIDQSGIYNPMDYSYGGYDTARLLTGYYSLFRANQFSGGDYINPANQFTIGAASRFYDDFYKERFNIAVGQTYYLDRTDSGADNMINDVAWAAETEFNFNDKLFVRGTAEYERNLNNLLFGNVTLEYRKGSFFAQTHYRYVSKNYISNTIGADYLNLTTVDGISQVGLVTGFPLGKGVSFQTQHFHDLTQDLTLAKQFGLTYQSACFVIGLYYNKSLLSRSSINDPAKYDSRVYFSLSFLGLGREFDYRPVKGNVLGHRHPFGLKN